MKLLHHFIKIPFIPCVVLLSTASQRDSGLRNDALEVNNDD